MTQDEIIRSPLGREQLVALAREAGMDIDDEASGFGAIITAEPLDLERFAALVAAHEREACAKSVYDSTDWAHEERDMVLKEAIAAAIRARGPNVTPG